MSWYEVECSQRAKNQTTMYDWTAKLTQLRSGKAYPEFRAEDEQERDDEGENEFKKKRRSKEDGTHPWSKDPRSSQQAVSVRPHNEAKRQKTGGRKPDGMGHCQQNIIHSIQNKNKKTK